MSSASRNITTLFGNRQGQSLVQVIAAVGIAGILMLVMIDMLSMQNREMQSLREKLAAGDFQQQLTRAFADGTVCTSLLTSPAPITFDSTNAVAGSASLPAIALGNSSIPVSSAPSAPALVTLGQSVSPIAANLVADPAQPFQITNIVGTNDGTTGVYTGAFQVSFDSSKLIRALHPAFVQLTLQTTSSGSTQTVTSCQLANPNVSTKIITTTVNAVNNAGGVCHDACGTVGDTILWLAACPSRYCRTLGYAGGVAQEYDCTGGGAVVLCTR